MREYVVDQGMESQLSVNKRWDVDSIRYTFASTPQLINQYYHLLEAVYEDYFANGFQVTLNYSY